MGGTFPYTDAPLFVAGAELPVTAGIELLEDNIALLDFVTRAGRDVAQGHSAAFEAIGDNPLQYWVGSFRYQPGLTTFTLVLDNQGVITGGVVPRYRLKLNGVTKQETALTAGVQTISYTSLASQGYAAGATVEVNVEIYDNNPLQPAASFPSSGWPGRFHFVDAYVSPVSAQMTTSWPGTPTFSTAEALSVTKLNQLSAASDWLALRVGLVPMNLFQWVRAMPGLYYLSDGGAAIPYPIWSGGMGSGRGTMGRLKILFSYTITGNAAETLSLRINGSQVASIGPLAAGAAAITTIDVSLTGYGSSTPLRFELLSLVTVGNAGERQSRYTVQRAWVEPSSVTALPAIQESFSYELTTFTTLISRLNSISTALAAVKSRIDGAPDLWDRARAFRRGYGYDDGQRLYFATRHLPRRERRLGAALVVDGANVTIGYGAQTVVPPPAEEPDGEYDVAYAYEETIVSGEVRALKLVSLDNLDGLGVGTAYALKSPAAVRFAAEYLLRE
jgi:hypothetical protein